MDGNNKLIQQLLANGVKYMFGNPGTVEEGFLDALDNYEGLKYITCLHESVAVAMADGYSRKSRKASVVQLHSGVGLGNAIGMIYQAMRGHSPLVIIAGEAGVKYDAMDAQMACNLVDMAKPVTKWAGKVTHKDSLLRMLRRAIKIAMTPPRGPVFLSLPLDILDEENNEDVIPASVPHINSAADRKDIEEAAKILAGASKPIFIIGDGVSASRAQNELERLADMVGASVYGADHSQYNFNTRSPLFKGSLGHMFGKNSLPKIKDADAVFVVGTYLLPEVFPSLETIFSEGAKVIHIDIDAYEIAKNHPVHLGMIADPKATISEICEKVMSAQTAEQRKEALIRKQNCGEKIMALSDSPGIAELFIENLARKLKQRSGGRYVIFDEALTSSPYLEKYFPMEKEGDYFQTRGGSLGVGIPGAMGIKLASPWDTVIAFSGDGGSMYTIQALNTAARYNIDIKAVILNNGSYKLLKDNIDVYRKERGIVKQNYPDCFNLYPSVDFTALAAAMGIGGCIKVKEAEEIEAATDKMLSSKGAFVTELFI